VSLWDTVTSWIARDAARYAYVSIRRGEIAGAPADAAPLVPDRDYFRLWLCEMCLRRDREWFERWYPAVHSLVRFRFGSQTVELPYVASGLELQGISRSNLDRVVQLNHPLTPLMPYSGDSVEVVAGLLALRASNNVASFVSALSGFGKLLAVPQLSAALAVAAPLLAGMQELVGATDGELHLGLHQTFAGAGGGGANELAAGYFCVALIPERDLDYSRLLVRDDRLYLEDGGAPVAFDGQAYMLFRIERRAERDDWTGLTAIAEPLDIALEALGARDDARAEAFLHKALAEALASKDLTRADRRRVAQAVDEEFKEARNLGLGAVARGDEGPALEQAMHRAISVDEALALGDLTFDELLRR